MEQGKASLTVGVRTALIAMSGGVDSSVAAALTLRAGFACTGCTMRLYENDLIGQDLLGTCCSLRDTEDARRVAESLGIPHRVFHYENEFLQKVVAPFAESYEQGFTPNPCINCNRYLKFDALYRRAEELGCRYLVTGHYARIEAQNGRWRLRKAADEGKDQSYVLFRLTEEQLSRTLFPLGAYAKPEIRRLAEELDFVNAGKKESQDICFVPDGDYAGMLERYRGRPYPSGPFVDTEGRVLGRHRGIVRYTVGQRQGLGLADPAGRRLYVRSLDAEKNTVIVAEDRELYGRRVLLSDLHWIAGEPPARSFRCLVKLRYRHREQPASVTLPDNDSAAVLFDQPQRAAARGQAAVFYDGDVVLGGGTIVSAETDGPRFHWPTDMG